MICRTLLSATKEGGACVGYVKKEANLTSKCWQASHLLQWKTHYWNLFKTQVLFQLFILFFFFFFITKEEHTEHPFCSGCSERRPPLWTLVWNTNYVKGLTEAEPNAWWQRLKVWQRGLRPLEGFSVFHKRSLQTSTSQPSGEGRLPYMSFILTISRKFVRKITENEKCIFYTYAIFKASFLPSPPQKVEPILSFPSKRLQLWHQVTGEIPHRRLTSWLPTQSLLRLLPASRRGSEQPLSPRQQPWYAI